MNHTKYGNIAIGQEGSIARLTADRDFLAQKLKLMEAAADILRDSFVPNNEHHPAVQAYNRAKNFRG